MNIFKEIKQLMTARQIAEGYGLDINKNGMACCPFHDDKHPSMKIEDGFYCFACGAKGDAIGYVAKLYGLSQYEAACKIIEDFNLPIGVRRSYSSYDKKHKHADEKTKIINIQRRFEKWCSETAVILEQCKRNIDTAINAINDEFSKEVLESNDFLILIHEKSKIGYWFEILDEGTLEDKIKFFKTSREEVKQIAERIERAGNRIIKGSRRDPDEGRKQCI
ncbi:MAG: DNA primase [Firmicutes bacterium]|nr:DNA primase [Bacillota bacterium]